jgi:hypothetical protein
MRGVRGWANEPCRTRVERGRRVTDIPIGGVSRVACNKVLATVLLCDDEADGDQGIGVEERSGEIGVGFGSGDVDHGLGSWYV